MPSWQADCARKKSCPHICLALVKSRMFCKLASPSCRCPVRLFLLRTGECSPLKGPKRNLSAPHAVKFKGTAKRPPKRLPPSLREDRCRAPVMRAPPLDRGRRGSPALPDRLADARGLRDPGRPMVRSYTPWPRKTGLIRQRRWCACGRGFQPRWCSCRRDSAIVRSAPACPGAGCCGTGRSRVCIGLWVPCLFS